MEVLKSKSVKHIQLIDLKNEKNGLKPTQPLQF